MKVLIAIVAALALLALTVNFARADDPPIVWLNQGHPPAHAITIQWEWDGSAPSYEVEIGCWTFSTWGADGCSESHRRVVTLNVDASEVYVNWDHANSPGRSAMHFWDAHVGLVHCGAHESHFYRARVTPINSDGSRGLTSGWTTSTQRICFITLELMQLKQFKAEVAELTLAVAAAPLARAALSESIDANATRIDGLDARMPLLSVLHSLNTRFAEFVKRTSERLDALEASNDTD